MIVRQTIYKVDSKGNIREWRMEIDGANYRTVAGIQGGQQVVSGWKEAFPKNVGRSNATTAEEQAVAEVDAKYTKKLDGEYHETVLLSVVHETLKSTAKAKFFKPMLAAKWEDRKAKITYPVMVQPKLDGVRAIIKSDGVWSRAGKKIVAVPHIEQQLAPLFVRFPDMVLDGELYNHDLRDDFNKIISLVRKTKHTEADLAESADTVEFHTYDFAHYPDLTYFERAKALRDFVEVNSEKLPSIVWVQTDSADSESEVDDLFGGYVEQGYEGGIIRLNGVYQQKRSNNLLKRKDFEDAEFEIISVEEGQGNWSGYAKTLFIRLPDGTVQQSGLAGNQDYLRQVLADREAYQGGEATVQYFTRTPDGKLRFPVAKALFKNSRDV